MYLRSQEDWIQACLNVVLSWIVMLTDAVTGLLARAFESNSIAPLRFVDIKAMLQC